MKSENTFTKKDVIVLLACVIFLLVNFAAVGETGRKRAKEALCLTNLLKWGQIFHAYTSDNNGFFHSRQTGGSTAVYEKLWPHVYKPYYIDPMMRCCPTAVNGGLHAGPYATWGGTNFPSSRCGPWVPSKYPILGEADIYYFGSYGMNRSCENLIDSRYTENWRRADAKCASQVPVFFDATYVLTWGIYNWQKPPDPPPYNGGFENEMHLVCIDRHGGGTTNVLFLDWSARKVGLKELWTLKWRRDTNICNIWTQCGGAEPNDWPEWMRDFKDY
jgi:prepilin-type processing-associated H-X9-DG protein